MMKKLLVAMVYLTILLAASRSTAEPERSPPASKQVSVNGTVLTYVDEGHGIPVVFVHGAYSDHRVWGAQRPALASDYRFIALDQRYFGTAAWPDDGAQFSQSTHVEDLGTFIKQLNIAPVFLVGRSYGAGVALALAVRHPDLVRGLFLNEPLMPSILTDPAEQQIVNEERKTAAPVREAASAGNLAEATKLLFDWVNAPGDFDALSPTARAIVLDNARTVPLTLNAPPPIPVTCAQALEIKVPVVITMGQLTRPFFRVLAQGAHRCIPGSRLVVISGVRHGAPTQNSAAFNEELLRFLSAN
jgi:pimeloyl-ACP methyl ester carboxylesterase